MTVSCGNTLASPKFLWEYFGFAEVSLGVLWLRRSFPGSTLASPKFLWEYFGFAEVLWEYFGFAEVSLGVLWLRRSFPLSHFPTFDI